MSDLPDINFEARLARLRDPIFILAPTSQSWAWKLVFEGQLILRWVQGLQSPPFPLSDAPECVRRRAFGSGPLNTPRGRKHQVVVQEWGTDDGGAFVITVPISHSGQLRRVKVYLSGRNCSYPRGEALENIWDALDSNAKAHFASSKHNPFYFTHEHNRTRAEFTRRLFIRS